MDSDQFFLYAGIAALTIGIYYAITQWAHQIHKRNRYLEAQINLLAKIADKQGISKEEIDSIIQAAQNKYSPLS